MAIASSRSFFAYFFRFTAAATLGALTVACEPVVPPPSAHFEVTATLETNSCGPQAVAADAVVRYRAELSGERGLVRWKLPSYGIDVRGTLDQATGSFRLTAEAFETLRAADRANGIPECTVRRLEAIDGVLTGTLPSHPDGGSDAAADDGESMDAALDAGASMDAAMVADASDASDASGPGSDGGSSGTRSFVAVQRLVIGPVEGAYCNDRLGASQGQYLALPCEVRYQLRGREIGADE